MSQSFKIRSNNTFAPYFGRVNGTYLGSPILKYLGHSAVAGSHSYSWATVMWLGHSAVAGPLHCAVAGP